MLVYFEPAAQCNLPGNLILAPLPAKKKLWEADSEISWKTESDKDFEIPTAFGLAADGGLTKLSADETYHCGSLQGHEHLDDRSLSGSNADWDEWCSGMDEFGGLVMLAASLVD